jgi:hypothetical protein
LNGACRDTFSSLSVKPITTHSLNPYCKPVAPAGLEFENSKLGASDSLVSAKKVTLVVALFSDIGGLGEDFPQRMSSSLSSTVVSVVVLVVRYPTVKCKWSGASAERNETERSGWLYDGSESWNEVSVSFHLLDVQSLGIPFYTSGLRRALYLIILVISCRFCWGFVF